jgi:hypothetical protein
MKFYDKSAISINGKRYYLEYKQRDGMADAAGFGFSIINAHNDEAAGYLRVLIFGTASAVWRNHTKHPYTPETAEDTARLAIDAVIPTLNLQIEPEYLAAMPYRGDSIIIQITTLDDNVAEGGTLVTLKAYNSPEEFVAKHLFGESAEKMRDAVLTRLDNWEERNYGIPYGTRELQRELFLSRNIAHRLVDYLTGPGVEFISKSPAGDDEYNLRLNPAGVDYVNSLKAIKTTASATFSQVSFEPVIFEALNRVDRSLGRSYEQVVSDLNDEARGSWKGTANELRETLSTLLRALAPDEKVITQEKYMQEKNTTGPTQKQRVKYILEQRRSGSNEVEVAQEVEAFEERIGGFIRKFYNRASNSTHRPSERKEILKIHSYFIAFMRDLLDIG